MSTRAINARLIRSIQEEFVHFSQESRDKIARLATAVIRGSVIESIGKLYNLYSVLYSLPRTPLYSLCTPALTAANYFFPSKMKSLSEKLPKCIRSLVAYKTKAKELVAQTAITALFLSLVSYCSTDAEKIAVSVVIMEALPKIITITIRR